MPSAAVKPIRKPRIRRTTPAQFKDACERLAATADGPVEFHSMRAMNEHIEANAGLLWSENPCQCGNARQWGHRYCLDCAAQKKRVAAKERQRRKRAG